MRVAKSEYIMDWETQRQAERDGLLAEGKRPYKTDLDNNEAAGTPLDFLQVPQFAHASSMDCVAPRPRRTEN